MSASLPETAHERLQAARLLAGRLERLSADSHWAHQASGLRGALLRSLEALERQAALPVPEPAEVESILPILEQLIERGYFILQRAARLIRTPETYFNV